MKLSLLGLVLLISAGVTAQTFTINKDKSVINWKGEKIVGNSHVGTLQFAEGSIKMKKGKLVGGSFVVDMTTMAESEGSTRLEGHLKSDDFFSVEKFPTASLEIKSSSEGENDDLEVTADLTIKGIKQEVTFSAMVKESGDGINGSADLVFDRAKFDVKYGSNSFFDDLADKAISDNITLTINIMASK